MKQRRIDRRAGIRGRVPALGATLLAPVAAYLIVQSAALALSPGIAAVAGATLVPHDYSVQLKALLKISQIHGQPLGARESEVVRAGALSMPLAHEPFFVAAKIEERAGRLQNAVILMEEAKRRRPNHTATRTQLVVYYGQRRDYSASIRELDYVMRRSDKARERLIPELVLLLKVPEGRDAIAELVAGEPEWRESFLRVAGDRNVHPDHAGAFLERVRARKGKGDLQLETSFYVRSLLGAGRYKAAKDAWLQMINQKDQEQFVFDGQFRSVKAPPPFNWSLQDLDVGRATIVKDSQPRLEIEYFGGRDAGLAEQTLALAPGRYKLSLQAKAPAPFKSGRLFWTIGCTDGRQLAVLNLAQLRPQFATYSADFEVPGSSCEGQKLQLSAEAGDYAGALSATVANVEIRRGS